MTSNSMRTATRSLLRSTASQFLLPSFSSTSSSSSILPLQTRLNSKPFTNQSSSSHIRQFCSTKNRFASESDDSLPPGMDKLMNNPEALNAISNLMSKMQENGIDLKSGERPSMAELAKLAVKEDVREATAKVVEALQKAGIEISPEAMQQALGMESELDLEGQDDGEEKDKK